MTIENKTMTVEKLIPFARFAIKVLDSSWEWGGSDVDGGDIQGWAEKFGLIQGVPYDPTVHGDNEYFEGSVGDTIYVMSETAQQIERELELEKEDNDETISG